METFNNAGINQECATGQDCLRIARRLFRRNIIGGKHLPESLVLSWAQGLPRKERERVIEEYEGMIKQGFIRCFPHTGEHHVSIIPAMLPRLRQLLRE